MATKAQYFAAPIEWSSYLSSYLTTAGVTSETAIAASYYDGELCQYWLGLYTGDTATYYARADKYNTAYAVTYGRGSSWGVPGYWAFGGGLHYRYTVRGDAAALSDLQDLCASAAYHVSGSLLASNVLRHELSREWAYCGRNLLYLKDADSLSAGQQTRLEQMYTDSLTIIDDWSAGQTASYFRPFMAGLTVKFLIAYYEEEADAGEKAAILAALETLATHAWTVCWNAAGQAMTYTDRDVGVTEDLLPAPDLSMIIAPLYAWLWSKTFVTDWKTKAGQLLDGAIPVYDGIWPVSGAYFGSRSADNPGAKQYNQYLYWGGKDFWTYYDAVATGQQQDPGNPAASPTARATSGLMLLGCGAGGPVTIVTAPVITVQPQADSVTEGDTGAFSVTATGTGLAYQWRKNGVNIGSATSSSYTTPATVLGDDGALYSVVVTNGGGSVTSDDAELTVTAAASWDSTDYGTVVAEWDISSAANVLKAGAAQAANDENIDLITPVVGAGNLTQTTDAKRPVLKTNVKNGLQVADFSGTDQWMIIPSGLMKNKGVITAVIVFQVRDTGGSDLIQLQGTSAPYTYFRAYTLNTNNNFSLAGFRSGGAGVNQNGSAGAVDTWYAGIFQYNYAGDLFGAWNNTGEQLTEQVADGAGTSPNEESIEGSTLGAGNIYGSLAANAQIGHVILYSTAFDSTARSNILSGLVAKWGALT